MCMSCLNVNVQCFNSVKSDLKGYTSFLQLTDSVNAQKIGDSYIIGGLNIVAFMNIRGSRINSNTIDPENPLDTGKKLFFKIRLTKLNPDQTDQLSYDLTDKDIEWDLSREPIKRACFKYAERTDVLPLEQVRLHKPGSYVIKILVRTDLEDKYTVQMVHPLNVKSAEKNSSA